MANGFFILNDRSCFTTRWTGYDEILRIVSRELREFEEGNEFADWLADLAPKEYIRDDPNQWGTGFIDRETGKTVIGKELDLRSLTADNQSLFWKAMKKGLDKLMTQKENYSFLNPDRLRELLYRNELSKTNKSPLEHSDWQVLADEEFDKLGPGWEDVD